MQTILLIVHVLVALSVIGFVLVQHGKGADAGAAFGSGASSTVFGSRGSASFLSRTTGVLAAVFFATSLVLAYLSGQATEPRSVTDVGVPVPMDTAPRDTSPRPADVPAAPRDSVPPPPAGR